MSRLTLIGAKEARQILHLSLPQVYALASAMPRGVVVRLGSRVRFNRDALIGWVKSGGSEAGRKRAASNAGEVTNAQINR
ncbi:hypothetical protein JST97_24240 [bacterium]|nr:hypothetical protein [bacterium]